MSLEIKVEQKIQDKLEQMAQSLGKTTEEIVNEAIGQYLEQLNVRSLEGESIAFERLYPQLKTAYLGQFVAIYQGQVVDVAEDFETLFLRIQTRYGDLPVLIRPITDSPVEEWNFRSPRLELNS